MITPGQVAEELIVAERERKEIALFTAAHPDFGADAAYEAQRLFVQSKLDAGQVPAGFKLGLTSRAKQQDMGVSEPLYGRVTSGMIASYGEALDIER